MHDLKRILQDLNDALCQDKRKVGVLLGAGCPAAVRVVDGTTTKALIPDISGLTRLVVESLKGTADFETLAAQFKEDGIHEPNVEMMLSHVRTLQRIVGAGNARGLDRKALTSLEEAICKAVYDATCVTLPTRESPYHKLSRWIRDVDRNEPVSLFTTNYDLLLEQALEEEEVPFFDGFTGARKPFLDVRAMEDDCLPARWARVWKLHGSISWRLVEGARLSVIRHMDGVPSNGGLLIHPSELKYDQSRRMPYLAMFDRLRAFLRMPGAVLITCGYSFADDHLNEAIIQGMTGNAGATTFGLLYRNLADEGGATRLLPRVPANMSLFAQDKAYIRRREEGWFDVDVPAGTGAPGSTPKVPEFKLGDFGLFAEFMSSLVGTKAATA